MQTVRLKRDPTTCSAWQTRSSGSAAVFSGDAAAGAAALGAGGAWPGLVGSVARRSRAINSIHSSSLKASVGIHPAGALFGTQAVLLLGALALHVRLAAADLLGEPRAGDEL